MGMYGQAPKSAEAVEAILREALFEVENFIQSTWEDARRIEHEAWDDLQEEPTIGNAMAMTNIARFEQRAQTQREALWQQCNRLKHDFSAFTQIATAINQHDEEREQKKNGTLATPLAGSED